MHLAWNTSSANIFRPFRKNTMQIFFLCLSGIENPHSYIISFPRPSGQMKGPHRYRLPEAGSCDGWVLLKALNGGTEHFWLYKYKYNLVLLAYSKLQCSIYSPYIFGFLSFSFWCESIGHSDVSYRQHTGTTNTKLQ